LSDEDRTDYNTIIERFTTKYAPPSITLWRRASELWTRDQRQGESVEEFGAHMNRRAREVNASADMTRYAIIRDLLWNNNNNNTLTISKAP